MVACRMAEQSPGGGSQCIGERPRRGVFLIGSHLARVEECDDAGCLAVSRDDRDQVDATSVRALAGFDFFTVGISKRCCPPVGADSDCVGTCHHRACGVEFCEGYVRVV